MGKKFNDFVNKLDEEAKKKRHEFNPQERIEKFQTIVNGLYNDIDAWLQPNIEDGKIQTGLVPRMIFEEALGSYAIDDKWLQIGNARLSLRPVGTILIGTNARVDLSYKTKNIMIVRTGEKIESPGQLITIRFEGEPAPKKKDPGKEVWKYVKENGRISYSTLNKESFENLVMNLIDDAR